MEIWRGEIQKIIGEGDGDEIKANTVVGSVEETRVGKIYGKK